MHSCLYNDSTIVISNLFSCQLTALVGTFASDCSFEMLVLIGGDWVLGLGGTKVSQFEGRGRKKLVFKPVYFRYNSSYVFSMSQQIETIGNFPLSLIL